MNTIFPVARISGARWEIWSKACCEVTETVQLTGTDTCVDGSEARHMGSLASNYGLCGLLNILFCVCVWRLGNHVEGVVLFLFSFFKYHIA
jgi:hypothetical protein